MRKFSTESKILGGFSVVLLVLILISAFAYRVTVRQIQSSGWVAHSYRVLATINDINSLLSKAESDNRSFVITGDDDYLHSRDIATAAVPGLVHQLETMVVDNPAQRGYAQDLEALVRRRLERLDAVVKVRGADPATMRTALYDSSVAMDGVHEQLDRMSQEEQHVLAERVHAEQGGAMISQLALLATLGGVLLFFGGVTWRIAREVARNRAMSDALAFSERRLNAILENISAAVYLKDLDGRFLMVNRDYEQRWGVARNAVLGKTVYEFLPQDLADKVRRSDQQVVSSRTGESYEASVEINGEVRTFQIMKFLLTDDAGNPSAVGSISYDITNRKRAEEAVQQSESRLTQILNLLPVGIANVDAGGTLVYANPEAQRIWGEIRPVSLERYSEYRVWYLDGRPVDPEQSALARAVRHGETTLNEELAIDALDGQRRIILNSTVPLRDQQGQIVGAVAVNQDITLRKQAQQRLVRTARFEQTHREVLSLFNQSFDRREILHSVLGLLARHHGIPVSAFYLYDEWAGGLQCEASWGASADLPATIRLGEGLIGQAALTDQWTTLSGLDHPESGLTIETGLYSFRPAQVVACPIVLQERRLGVLAMAVGRELREDERGFIERLAVHLAVALQGLKQYSDIKLMAEQLRQHGEEIARKNAQLEEASRMKSEFLANMSHELRTPLNAIIGFSEALKDGLLGALPEQQLGAMQDIYDSGQHLLSLINDILDLSKVEAGKMMLEPELADLRALVSNSITIVKEKAHDQGLQLSVDVDAGIGQAWLDPRKVKQILYNLLSNAVKFTPSGGSVRLTVRLCPPPPGLKLAPADQYVELAVTDTGIGIPRDQLDRLFEPFSQLESSLSRRFQGTGLGLAMVRKLAELHGGTVSVQSDTGAGARFSVWLPYRPTQPGAAAGEARAPRPGPAAGAGRALTVLVVGDEDRAADLIRMQLESEGMRVRRALTADAALEMALNQPPDLITLDILLPGMDGWQFLERLKTHPQLAEIPVVMISIVADSDRGLALGAAQVLQKPLRQSDLSAALAACGLTAERMGRVLIIDDDPRAVDLIALLLGSAGHSVLRAYGGAEGIQIAREQRPDMIVLDLMMPEVSGFEVVEALKQSPETAQTPILIMTAKLLSPQERSELNGRIVKIVEKAELDRLGFLNEVRRALVARRAAS